MSIFLKRKARSSKNLKSLHCNAEFNQKKTKLFSHHIVDIFPITIAKH